MWSQTYGLIGIVYVKANVIVYLIIGRDVGSGVGRGVGNEAESVVGDEFGERVEL